MDLSNKREDDAKAFAQYTLNQTPNLPKNFLSIEHSSLTMNCTV